jgi:hypothetical protein
LPIALAVSVLLAAAGPADEAAAAEPSLAEAQEAAARVAGGTTGDEASREARARRSHWAPQVRAQGQFRDDEKTRAGEYRLAPLREQDVTAGRNWSLALTWDFSQVIFAREETQLALAQAHLARARREAAAKAAQLWIERRQARVAWLARPAGPARAEACFGLLRLTADLDALTGGLFREALARCETACNLEEKQ